MVCSCPLGVQALGFPSCCRSGSAITCVLPGATQHDLQSNLQMAATCAGLGVSQVKPSYESILVAAGAGPWATYQEVQGLETL